MSQPLRELPGPEQRFSDCGHHFEGGGFRLSQRGGDFCRASPLSGKVNLHPSKRADVEEKPNKCVCGYVINRFFVNVELRHGAPQEARGRRERVILLPVTWRPQLSSCQISCNVPVQKKKTRLLNPIVCAQAKSLSHRQSISIQTSAASRSCPCILMNSSKGSNYKVLWHLRHLRCHKTMFFPKDPYFIMYLLHCRRLSAFFLVHCSQWQLESSGPSLYQHTRDRRTQH